MRRPLNWAPVALLFSVMACGGAGGTLTELQRVRSGSLDVVLLSARDALQRGKGTFVIEFRSATDGSMVDVGAVKAGASMPMAGTPMFGSIDVQPSGVKGRYTATSEFSMAGTWRLTLEWSGAAGNGSVALSGRVQ